MKIRYFAWVREQIGLEEEELALPDSVATVADLIDFLRSRDDQYAAAFENDDTIRCALDKVHVEPCQPLKNAQEAAFFPPMTGG